GRHRPPRRGQRPRYHLHLTSAQRCRSNRTGKRSHPYLQGHRRWRLQSVSRQGWGTQQRTGQSSGRRFAGRGACEVIVCNNPVPSSEKNPGTPQPAPSSPKGSTFTDVGTNRQSGLTLVELIITIAIVSILATAAIPLARFQVKRTKERELRRDLWEMRAAIDAYKDAADKGGIM